MKKKINKIILCLIIIINHAIISNAASIEIIPSQNKATTITVSQSFNNCRGLDSEDSTLGTTRLDPHLVTNKDWSAVSYLSNSIYGTNTAGQNSGINVKIKYNGKEYTFKSTNGNATGVMNWGDTRSYTASINKLLYDAIKNANSMTEIESLLKTYKQTSYGTEYYGENVYINFYSLLKELLGNKNSRYIEIMNKSNSLGTGTTENAGLYSSRNLWNDTKVFPATYREGLFGYNVGTSFYSGVWGNCPIAVQGGAVPEVTFRPAIWNIE